MKSIQKKPKYPFMIANTDPERKLACIGGPFWTRMKETRFFFDSFRSYGLLNFIMTNDMDIFKKTYTGPIETTVQRR